MNELSLFTGAGGGLLGTKLLGWKHKGYVEINEYCQKAIAQKIEDGILDRAPIFRDIRAFIGEGYAAGYQGMVDVVTGGFPCQPFSCAGKRKGEDDERNMWPETREVIRLVRPPFVFLENVPGLLSSGYFPTVISDLAESGYDVRWKVLSAAEVGAPHKRDRLWVLGYSERRRQSGDHGRGSGAFAADGCEDVADTDQAGCKRSRRALSEDQDTQRRYHPCNRCEDVADAENSDRGRAGGENNARWRNQEIRRRRIPRSWIQHWSTEPAVCGMVDELAEGVDKC